MRLHLLLLAVFLHPGNLENSTILSRRRRYLGFPDKSNFAITITLLKPTAFMNGVNTLHEIDFLVPLPKNPHALLRRSVDEVKRHSIWEREVLLGQVESALDMFSFDGALCLQRMMCEVRNIKEDVANSLVVDVISRIFSLPYSDLDEMKDCNNGCPFSIFHKTMLNGS